MLTTIGRWAAELRAAPLPPEVAHHAKRVLLDWVAATVPGGVMEPAQVLTRSLVNDDERGASRLIPGGRSVPLRTAALINATASHTAEADDIFREGIYHPGSPTVAAALAAAQHRGSTGRELLTAIVVGYEFSTRVAANMQPEHYRFWHTTGTIGTLGAAAAVASILDLDEDRFAHAVATSTTMAAALQQAFRSDSMSKPLHAGHAADAGALAAMAAEHGYTGALDVITGPAGLGAGMSRNPDWDGVFDDLGTHFNITQMTVKNHLCCGHTFAAIDGALELREAHAFDPSDVEKVTVGTYQAALNVAGNPDPKTAVEARFSLPYVVAAAISTGSVRLDAFSDERLADPLIRQIVARTDVNRDPELDDAFPGLRGADVTIRLADGSEFTAHPRTRKGDPDAPLTDAELDDKFSELVGPLLGDEATAALGKAIWSADELDEVLQLVPVTAVEQA